MVARQARLDGFPSEPERGEKQRFDLLCEDHCGTYTLPFGCYWCDGKWRNEQTGEIVEAKVIGWRQLSKT
jgi:hypothetical protein